MLFKNFSFMKVNRNRRYDYTPRYYDERKEKLRARIEKYQNEENKEATDTEVRLAELRDRISDNWVRGDEYKQNIFKSNIRLVIILAVILALVYFIFSGLEIGGTYIEQLKEK